MNLDGLEIAIGSHNLEGVNEYIRGGGDVNLLLGNRMTPLVYATYICSPSERGNIDEIILRLIDEGANVNVRDISFFQRNAIMWAMATKRNEEIVLKLINAGTDMNLVDGFGMTTLNSALRNKYGKYVIKAIIDKGADVNFPPDEPTSTTLYLALVSADIEVIKMVLQAGVRIHSMIGPDQCIFKLYCRDRCKVTDNCRFKWVTDFLIRNGIDLKMKDCNNNTVIHLVTCNYIISLAQKAGVWIDQPNDLQETALLQSISMRLEHKVNDLLFLGANPNWTNLDGKTILYCDHPNFNQFGNLLIYHGANINAVNNSGETPLSQRFRQMTDSANVNREQYPRFHLLRVYLPRIKATLLNYLLYEDATRLLDVISRLEFFPDVLYACNRYIDLCKVQLNGMKNCLLTEDLSIHQFCHKKRFYSSKTIHIESDKYLISPALISKNFPTYKDIILMRIDDNKRNSFKKLMMNMLPNFHVKSADEREIELTYDAMYYIGKRFLNYRYLYDFISVSFVH